MSVGRPRSSWEENILIDLEALKCDGLEEIQLT
jgi:hypothetical protein